MEKAKGILIKLFAILFLFGLFGVFLLPIWRATDNSVDEYRDLYRYQDSAKKYYRALRSSVNNLSQLSSEMEGAGEFTTLNRRSDLLANDQSLNNRVAHLFATLQTIPDPGDRSLVSAVLDCHEAYITYRNLIFSGNYHFENYDENLRDARLDLRECELELFEEVYEDE